jgi:hypothetical protein
MINEKQQTNKQKLIEFALRIVTTQINDFDCELKQLKIELNNANTIDNNCEQSKKRIERIERQQYILKNKIFNLLTKQQLIYAIINDYI